MDFARKQLEKYGWSEGKGLGKSEDGMVQALKLKPKHGSGGIGHDIAEEFTNHWWQKLYNKATENIEIKKTKNGEVDSIITKNPGVLEISTQKFVKPKKRKGSSKAQQLYSESFTKRSKLTNGAIEAAEISNEDDSSSEEESIKFAVKKLTDEELFAACGGRTAHKAARHGLKLNGKLTRIEQHEEHILKNVKEKKEKKCSKSDQQHSLTESPTNERKHVVPQENISSESICKKSKRKHSLLNEKTDLSQGCFIKKSKKKKNKD